MRIEQLPENPTLMNHEDLLQTKKAKCALYMKIDPSLMLRLLIRYAEKCSDQFFLFSVSHSFHLHPASVGYLKRVNLEGFCFNNMQERDNRSLMYSYKTQLINKATI